MMKSVRVKVASVLLATTAIAGAGVAISGQAQAAGGRSVNGVWVNGYVGQGFYDTGRGWEWSVAWDRCTRTFNNVRSVKFLGIGSLGNEEYRVYYACSDAERP